MENEEKKADIEVQENESAGMEKESIEEKKPAADSGIFNNRMKIMLGILLCAAIVFLIWKNYPSQEPEVIQIPVTVDFDTALKEFAAGDPVKGFEQLKIHSDAGVPQAQYFVALALCDGRGTEKNVPEALKLAEKASTQLPNAMDITAGIYLGLSGNEYSDQDKAFAHSEKMVNKGLASGFFYHGICYMNGIGCTRNVDEAFRLITVAAQSGYPHAVTLMQNWNRVVPRPMVNL
jgi:TPR repeat protein